MLDLARYGQPACDCGHVWGIHDVYEYPGDDTETCCVHGCDQDGCPGSRLREVARLKVKLAEYDRDRELIENLREATESWRGGHLGDAGFVALVIATIDPWYYPDKTGEAK